jgi:hypothetical protein
MPFPPSALGARDDSSLADSPAGVGGQHAQDHTDERSAINTTVAELVTHEADTTAHNIPTQITTALAPYATSAAVAAGYQPLDSDLTAIAALTTTSFGRAFLAMADAATVKTALSLVKGDVGLGNVDNTSDATKFTSPTVTGHPTVEGVTSTGATGTGKFVFDGSPTLVTPNIGAATATSVNGTTIPASKTLVTADQAGSVFQAYNAALQTLATTYASLTVPAQPRRFDRIRGGYGPHSCKLTTALTDTTGTALVPDNQNLTRSGVNESVLIDSERLFVTGGQGSIALVDQRGTDGTTAATHSAGAQIRRSRLKHCAIIGDSLAQGTNTAGYTGNYDSWADILRRTFNDRFGGVIGRSFPTWRPEWAMTNGSTRLGASTENLGPGLGCVVFSAGTGNFGTFTIPAGMDVAAIEIVYVDVTTSGRGDFSLSFDDGANYDAPNTNYPATRPSATTLRKSLYTVNDYPKLATATTIKIRAANTSGTTSAFTLGGEAVIVYETIPVFGQTEGWVFHNAGRDSHSLQIFTQTRGIGDLSTTSGSANASSARDAAFVSTDVGYAIINPNLPSGSSSSATIAASTGNIALTAHGRAVGDLIIPRTVTTTVGLQIGQAYWVTAVTDANNFKIGTSSGGSSITFTNDGSCTFDYYTAIKTRSSATAVVLSQNATATVDGTTTSNPASIWGTQGDYARWLDGDPGSIIPDLIVLLMSNSMSSYLSLEASFNGQYSFTGGITSGSPTLTGSNFAQSDVGKPVVATGVTAGTTVLSVQSSSSLTMSANATATNASAAVILGALEATSIYCVKNDIDILAKRVAPYAAVMWVNPIEQGASRLDGSSATATWQADYRSACKTRALANGWVVLDLYDAFAAQGYVGFAACNTAGLVNSLDSTAFHFGPDGNVAMGSLVSRVPEIF